MAAKITRCPKCETSFRISDAHLKSAKGAVRCGSCLNVFNAKDHLVASPTPKKANKQDSEQKTHEDKQKKENTAENSEKAKEEDILISDDMDLIHDTQSETKVPEDDFDPNFDDITINAPQANLFERHLDTADDEDSGASDESWALDLLNSDDDDTTTKSKPEDNTPKETKKSSFHIIDDTDGNNSPPEVQNINTDGFYLDDLDSNYDQRYDQNFDDPDASPKTSHTKSQNHHYLHAIEPEPVEFSWQTSSPLWRSPLLWGGLSTLAALGITLQLAWINFASWSRIEPYRAYYEVACKQLNCTLPALLDRSKIRTANLVVRSHPKLKDALVVDAVLQNFATFPQPFPDLDLVFMDIDNRALAARRFRPSQYLGGELTGRTSMPSGQPVHIALEIADPGSKAVSYQLTIGN